jgi:hypothetical protein
MTNPANGSISSEKSIMTGLGTFSKLPPELRIQIYNYALFDGDEEIHAVPTIRRKMSKEAARKRIELLNRGATEGRPMKKPVAAKNAILYVSKQISDEACAVLYSGAKFEFGIIHALDWFLVLIGKNKQYLRHIRVVERLHMSNFPPMGHILDNLVDVKGLRSLTLLLGVRRYYDLENSEVQFTGDDDTRQSEAGALITKLALVSGKLLKSLHKAQKPEDRVAGVLGIFHLDFTPCDESSCETLFAFWEAAVKVHVSGSEEA